MKRHQAVPLRRHRLREALIVAGNAVVLLLLLACVWLAVWLLGAV